jgi:hypothetical protein
MNPLRAETLIKKVIPILPCPDIRTQVAFYQQLGFEILGVYTSPNPYAALKFGSVELHFYGSRKIVPHENPSMCFITVQNVDAVYDAFAGSLKANTGKIPRSGIPRMTKVRDLVADRRFTLTDTGGNTIFIGCPKNAEVDNFFRTLENKEMAKKFTVLYDIVYSKEDCSMAADMLPKFDVRKESLGDLDKAKFLLVTLEVQSQLKQPLDDEPLKALLELHTDNDKDWKRIEDKYNLLLKAE